MPSFAVQTDLTPEEYLSWERKRDTKHEYLRGQIVSMPGASFPHNVITSNVTTLLNNQLMNSDCIVVASDMRVRTHPAASYFYPDVLVVCDEPRFEDSTFDTLLNPIILVEVLSPSTEAYDRGEKFKHYQQLTSLREYILVSQGEVRIEHYHRQETEWKLTEFRSFENVLPLASIECELALQDIYRRVEFGKNQL